jgi:acetoin utilization protein AcuA
MISTSEMANNTKEINTSQGQVFIEGPVDKDRIAALLIDPHLSNFRNPGRQKEALMLVAESPEGMVYIARHGKTIIGYLSFHPPSTYTRWSRHPRILELGAIEVSPPWRRFGIASRLLETAFQNEILEEYIVIVCEFQQHWDLQGTRMNAWNYQRMLTRLYGSVGFKKRRTDDPDILEHPANMLLVRFGRKVNSAYVKAFEDLTYQQSIVD